MGRYIQTYQLRRTFLICFAIQSGSPRWNFPITRKSHYIRKKTWLGSREDRTHDLRVISTTL
uniref:Uncharacterized protein n=1 Tax=Anopheles minimus TaxID=112268 RepID=A0A182WN47_9DIPT